MSISSCDRADIVANVTAAVRASGVLAALRRSRYSAADHGIGKYAPPDDDEPANLADMLAQLRELVALLEKEVAASGEQPASAAYSLETARRYQAAVQRGERPDYDAIHRAVKAKYSISELVEKQRRANIETRTTERGVKVNHLRGGAWVLLSFAPFKRAFDDFMREVKSLRKRQGPPARLDPIRGTYAMGSAESRSTSLQAAQRYQAKIKAGESADYDAILAHVRGGR